MKTFITSTRIPANQANGSYNILLPQNFGQPKGFLVYAMPYSVQPNNFDSTTTFPCISVGFGGSNIAGTGLTNACVWVSNQDGADPTSTLASFGNTVSVFSRNIANTVFRQWQMTNFGQGIIFGTYTSGGTQVEPMDLVFTVFGGNDFFCAVGQTAVVAAVNTRTDVATPFRPDAILYSHIRPAQTTDGQITFGAAVRNVAGAGLAITTVLSDQSGNWRNQDAQGTSIVQNRNSNTGSFNFATNAVVRFTSMFDSGFAVTQSTANTGNSIIFLAMKAGTGNTTIPRFKTQVMSNSASGTTTIADNNFLGCCHVLGYFSNLNSLNTTQTTSAAGADMCSFFTANGRRKISSGGIGTFTSSTSSTTITGVGTSFLGQLGAIDTIYNQNYQLVGIVSSITSNTSLLLQSNAAITATGSSFIFEKPKQFSMSYGNLAQDGAGNASMRGYFSDSSIISFTAATPTLTNVGRLVDFQDNAPNNLGAQNQRTIRFEYTTSTSRSGGWLLMIRNEEYFNLRGSIF
jgi:hypothetical protein